MFLFQSKRISAFRLFPGNVCCHSYCLPSRSLRTLTFPGNIPRIECLTTPFRLIQLYYSTKLTFQLRQLELVQTFLPSPKTSKFVVPRCVVAKPRRGVSAAKTVHTFASLPAKFSRICGFSFPNLVPNSSRGSWVSRSGTQILYQPGTEKMETRKIRLNFAATTSLYAGTMINLAAQINIQPKNISPARTNGLVLLCRFN